MKRFINLFMIVLSISFLASCGGSGDNSKVKKTIENLKAGITGETTASAKYAAFSQKAKEEGLMQIAALFEATSKAESIHAANHSEVLKKLGGEMDKFEPQFEVKSTKENLEDALKGETYEVTTMYPDFIKSSEEEGADDATKSFTWASDTEKKHQVLYQKALDAIANNNVAGLSAEFYVCPKCGNTFDAADIEQNCSFCMTSKEKYFEFKI